VFIDEATQIETPTVDAMKAGKDEIHPVDGEMTDEDFLKSIPF